MISLETFLNNYNGNYFMITDNNGRILYPEESEKLIIFNKIIKSNSNDNGYYIYNNCYYEYHSQIIIENGALYNIECLENVTKFEEENVIAKTDYITNLGNKRLTYERFNNFVSKSIYKQVPFACIIADADYFKNVNDTYGHLYGDKMLKSLGEILYNNTRQKHIKYSNIYRNTDIVGRVGGEEFLIVLYNVSALTAYGVANKIKRKIERGFIDYKDKTVPLCTMSFGLHHVSERELSEYQKSDNTIDEIRDNILEKCDKALYVSKINGRNQINVFGVTSKENLDKLMCNNSLSLKK